MENNTFDKKNLDRIHHYLNLQENVTAKIDRHTKNVQIAYEKYDKIEKKLTLFDSKNVNFFSLFYAVFFFIINVFIGIRLTIWLIYLHSVPSNIIIFLYTIILLATFFVMRYFWQRSFKNYKKKLEMEATYYKNTIDQSKKNIDNRIRELHEIQQKLQQLWVQK